MYSGIGLFFIAFGVLVISFPDLIAYIIGYFFLFLGINIFLMRFLASRNSTASGWKFGSFEIIRNRNNK